MTQLSFLTIKTSGKSLEEYSVLVPKKNLPSAWTKLTSITFDSPSLGTVSITIQDAPELARSKQELSSLLTTETFGLVGPMWCEPTKPQDSQKQTPSCKQDSPAS